MKPLKIHGTKDNPHVLFDNITGKLYIGGTSLPENVIEFYDPIIKWLENYKLNTTFSTQVEFNFDYLNTASTYMVLKIIKSLQDLMMSCIDVKITWRYPTGDYDMKELGIDILENSECNYEVIETG